MLESTSERLCEKGGVHYGSPDKHPAVRLETIRLAGELKVPFTTGILIGIGETREERIEALRAIGDLHAQYGHIQEVIVQNFRAKSDTKLRRRRRARSRRPLLDHRPGAPDPRAGHEHPGAAQPVARRLSAAGRGRPQRLGRRLAGDARPREPRSAVARRRGAGAQAAPRPARFWSIASPSIRPTSAQPEIWLAPEVATQVRRMSDAEGLARDDDWAPGNTEPPPAPQVLLREVDPEIVRIVDRATGGKRLDHPEIQRAVHGARRRLSPCHRGGRRAAPGGERRGHPLRRQPQHQLHQHLLLPLPASAPSPRAARTTTCAASPTIWRWRRCRGAPSRRGSAAPPRSACRAASIPTTPARPTKRSAAPSRKRCRACTSMPSRRSR